MQLLSYFHRRNDRFALKPQRLTTFSFETIAHEHKIICVQNIDQNLRMRKRYSALSLYVIYANDAKSILSQRLLSIMPNRPVRDKWDYPRKMERHFPIKPRQPIRNSSCHFLSFPNSLIRAKNRFVKNGTANFDRNNPTEISGPPPKVIPNIPVGRNRNGPSDSDKNFRNLWHDGKHSKCPANMHAGWPQGFAYKCVADV